MIANTRESICRRSGLRRAAMLLVAGLMAGTVGCARSKPDPIEVYKTREKALQLIDEGRDLQDDRNPLLALDRYNRAALIYNSPAAFFEMGRLFETNHKDEQAATAYQQALDLAPDYQEAKLAMLALGFTPPGYTPTENDLELAAQLAQRRDKARAASAREGAADEDESASEGEAGRRNREDLLAAAAERRLPTQAEVAAVIFAPETHERGLPSALDPVYATDTDIILGTYAYHYQKAVQLRRRSQFEAAADEFERAIQADPSRIDARLDLGDMLMRIERGERALYHYQRALEDFSSSPRPYHKLGNYYLDLDRNEEARKFYRLAIERDPGYVEAANNLAVLAMRERDYDEAKRMLDQVIEIDPSYSNAYLNRGIIASDIDGDLRVAIDSFKQYVTLEGPRSAEVRRWIRELEAELE